MSHQDPSICFYPLANSFGTPHPQQTAEKDTEKLDALEKECLSLSAELQEQVGVGSCRVSISG